MSNNEWYYRPVTHPDSPRATAITVINLQGGVGKTHAVWLLAAVCQEWLLQRYRRTGHSLARAGRSSSLGSASAR